MSKKNDREDGESQRDYTLRKMAEAIKHQKDNEQSGKEGKN